MTGLLQTIADGGCYWKRKEDSLGIPSPSRVVRLSRSPSRDRRATASARESAGTATSSPTTV